MTVVVSGFSPEGYRLYGRRFMQTFHEFWPSEVKLRVYTEEAVDVPRGGLRSLWACPGIREFLERHKSTPEKNGRACVRGWAPKDIAKGYCYRFDAVKFSRQCVIPHSAAEEEEDGEILVWLDADTLTYKTIPRDFVESFIHNRDLCFLGRNGNHSEIGFWAVRLNARTREFLTKLAEAYIKDHVFRQREWHSAYVFDQVRALCPTLDQHNLTPKGFSHVWFQTPLGQYMDHLKGDRRKKDGRSLERKQ